MVQGEIPPQLDMRIGGARGFVPYAATASLLASAMGAPPGNEVCSFPKMATFDCSRSLKYSLSADAVLASTFSKQVNIV